MKKVITILILAVVIVACTQSTQKEPADTVTVKKAIASVDGKQLEQQLWADFKTVNIEAISEKMSDGFQSVHQDGARNKEQELALLKNLNLGEYELTNFEVSQHENVVVVTYMITVTETIDGKVLSKEPCSRMSVWINTNDDWKWISHANLNPLK